MNNETQTHTSKNGETYYSRVEDGEIIYSFTTDFADIWTQDEEELYGENSTINHNRRQMNNITETQSGAQEQECTPRR